MAPRTSVPILLLTGFLGSGKTSLLAHWLRSDAFAGAMVIVNELGEVGLDDRLVETSHEAPLLLDNGCACCAASEDLAATLERLFFDRLHRKIPTFSWVLIETTGIAEPGPILDLIAGNALVRERYHVEAVVTCFDARRGADLLATQPEVRKQIEAAQVVVLTKTDLVDEAGCALALAEIGRVRPEVSVLFSGRVPSSCPSPLPGRGDAPDQGAQSCESPSPRARGEGQGEGVCDLLAPSLSAAVLLAELSKAKIPAAHGHNHHAHHLAGISTAFAPLPSITRPALEAGIDLTLMEFGADLLRMKGIIAFIDEPGYFVVQAEAGLPIEIRPLPVRTGDEPQTGMTLIARKIPAADMAAALLSCVRAASPPPLEGGICHGL